MNDYTVNEILVNMAGVSNEKVFLNLIILEELDFNYTGKYKQGSLSLQNTHK